MKVGVNLLPQNYLDWERHSSGAYDAPLLVSDTQVLDDAVAFAALVEPLGFDSLWTVEHHFSPYILGTDPLQFLTFFAGRTEKIDFGTMVIVLPWHDPVRVAERIALLDNFLNGRRLYLGFGRGTAQIEFDGFRIPRQESRERFMEALDVVRTALSSRSFMHEGKYFQIPEITLRPYPRNPARLLDDIYMSWGSPESVPVAARNGLKPLIVPQKDWTRHQGEIEQYNAERISIGLPPERPITMLAVYCAESSDEVERGHQFIAEWNDSHRRHYQLENLDQWKNVGGYEWRAEQARLANTLSPADLAAYREKTAPGHVTGTPQEVIRQLTEKLTAVGAAELCVTLMFGSMPLEIAQRSMRLFAREVLPAIHAMDLPAPRLPSQGAEAAAS
jgi:alkanesulfonate monooxygenase SsuD/methylene tetrahydromethanopterin reductase-like flavin-dependent oxidoreductase (luciferase family)